MTTGYVEDAVHSGAISFVRSVIVGRATTSAIPQVSSTTNNKHNKNDMELDNGHSVVCCLVCKPFVRDSYEKHPAYALKTPGVNYIHFY